MKQKLLTLMTLLLFVCSGAWATEASLKTLAVGTTSFKTGDTGYHQWTGAKTKNQVIYDKDDAENNRLMGWSNGNALEQDGTGLKFGNSSKKSAFVFRVGSTSNISVSVARNGSDMTVSLYYLGTTTDVLTDPNDMTPTGALSSVNITSSNTTGTLTKSGAAAGYYMVFGTLRFIAESITVTSSTTYTVTYKAGAGTGDDVVDDKAATVADCPGTFTAPSGKAFSGWNTKSDGDGTAYAVGATVTSDLTLFAQWANVYTVTFNLQGHGDAIDAQNIIHGGKVIEPTAPTASGYDFGGWYKEAGCENAWNFDTDVVTETKTLFAKWTEHVAPTYGNLFSWTSKTGLSDADLTAGTYYFTSVNPGDWLNSISGGSVEMYVSENKKIRIRGSQLAFNGNDSYIHIILNDPLAANDCIDINSSGNTGNIWISTSTTRPADAESAAAVIEQGTTFVIDESSTLKGKRDIYLWRSSGTVQVGTININRPASVTITNLSAVDGSTYTGKNYATLYYSDAAIAVPAGVKAYTYKIEGGNLTVSRTYENGGTYPVIPAGEAVVLETETGASYNFNMATTATTVDTESLLAGSDAETTVDATGYKYYKLSMNDDLDKVGFYFAVAGGASITNGAHKAYLAVPVGGDAKNFFVLGGEDEANNETTAINAVDIAIANGATIYNLAGQKVGADYKGIVVINGKKVVRK